MDGRGLNIREEIISNKKHIVIQLQDTDKIVDFEINMLQNNLSLPFLQFELLQINSTKKIIYDIGSKESLSSCMSNQNIGSNVLLDIIESIFKIINLCNEFMLDNNKIILNFDYIFFEKSSSLVYMMFIPIDVDSQYSVDDEFKTLSKKIINKIKKNKEELTSNQKRIIALLSKKTYDFAKLKQEFINYDMGKNNRNEPEILESNSINSEESIKDKIYDNNEKTNDEELSRSIIYEDYEDVDGIDLSDIESDEEDEENDEDLNYKEYKEIQKFEKRTNNNILNKILILQLVVVMLIGSLVLVFSVNDKEYFIMMVSVMVFVFLLLVVLIVLTIRKMRK